MSELLRNMEAAYRYQLGQQQRSPDPRDVAIQELKADQQAMREQMNEMYGYLTEMKGRVESLVAELLVALSEVRNKPQLERDWFDGITP